MIQVLTYDGSETNLSGAGVIVNRLHDARSLDEFEINIIDLNNEGIWEYSRANTNSIDMISDFSSLRHMIYGCKKSIIIILLPNNCKFSYIEYGRNVYTELKDIISNMKDDILSVLYEDIKTTRIVYENTRTRICGEDISASFYFDISDDWGEVLTKSVKSEKVTTVRKERIILSFLQLHTYSKVIGFLKEIGLIVDKQEEPEWLKEIRMFDDDKQYEIIRQNTEIIRAANQVIDSAIMSINKNKRYKSILYTTGDELVEVVFEILTEMLGCDLSKFEDKKKEDFLFEIDKHVFIGEIKGVNHNVKNENVSQLDVHYQSYRDEHQEMDEKNISSLLIINHQKNKPVSVRESVHANQINLAKRNGSLIVDTSTLLKLFEKYISGEIRRAECIDVLKSNIGLLEI